MSNFYNYKGINQNLTFDIVYNNRKTMLETTDTVFPKRLAIISYGIGQDYIDNVNIDMEEYGKTYDSTIWQKQVDGSYLPIADLDSVTIEIDTLDLTGQEGVMLGLNSEKQAIPIALGVESFLKVDGANGEYIEVTLTDEEKETYLTIAQEILNELVNEGKLRVNGDRYGVINNGEQETLQSRISNDIRFYLYKKKEGEEGYKRITCVGYGSGGYGSFQIQNDPFSGTIYKKENTQLTLNHKVNYNSNMVASDNTTINFQNVDIEESHITNSTKHSISAATPLGLVKNNGNYTIQHNNAVFNSNYVIPTVNNTTINLPKLSFTATGHISSIVRNDLNVTIAGDEMYTTATGNDGVITISHKNAMLSATSIKSTAPSVSGTNISFPNLGFDNKGHLINNTSTNKNISFTPVGDITITNNGTNGFNFSHKNATFNSSCVQPSVNGTTVSLPKLSFTATGHISLNNRSDLNVTFNGGNYITTSGNNGTITIGHANYTAGNSSGKIEFNSNAGSISFTFPTVSRDSGGHVDRFDTYGTSLYVDNSQILLNANNAGKPVIQHKNDYQEYSYDTSNSGWSSIGESHENPENIELVLIIPTPRFKINSYGHVEKVDNTMGWSNDLYIYSDGIIYFDNNTTNDEGRICHRDALTDLPEKYFEQEPNLAIINDKYVQLRIPILKFDNQGHFINNEETKGVFFRSDDSLNILKSGSNVIWFEHYSYNEDLEEELITSNNLQLEQNLEIENLSYSSRQWDGDQLVETYEFYNEIKVKGSRSDRNYPISGEIYYADNENEIISSLDPKSDYDFSLSYIEENVTNKKMILKLTYHSLIEIKSVQGYTNKPATISMLNLKFNNAGHYRENQDEIKTFLNFDPNYFSILSNDNTLTNINISLNDILINKITELETRLAALENA